MTNTTRHALPLPVTLLIAWAVGIAVFLALRALTTLIPQPTDSTSIVARANPNIILAVLTSAGTSLASALTLPRTRAGSLPLTLASALPAPILAYTYIGLTLPSFLSHRTTTMIGFPIIGIVGALIGALPPLAHPPPPRRTPQPHRLTRTTTSQPPHQPTREQPRGDSQRRRPQREAGV